MRKTSHDGADSTSITSDYETKKSISTISKIKKNSIKRKVQNFSHESDDGIIEPLLQTDKEKIEIANKSAKFLINKTKTDTGYERGGNISNGLTEKCSVTTPVSSTSLISNNINESQTHTYGSATIHNHMNTNVFGTFDMSRGFTTTKSPVLVELDSSKPGGYSPSPLIFTTAKIHTDSKTKLMEPLQVTPVPILSTIEGSLVKAEVVNTKMTSPSCEVGKKISETSDSSLTQGEKAKVVPLPKPEVMKKVEPVARYSEEATKTQNKDQRLSNLSNIATTIPEVSKSISNELKSINIQPSTDTRSNYEKDKLPSKSSKSDVSTSLDKFNNTEKLIEKASTANNSNISKILKPLEHLQKVDSAPKKSVETSGAIVLNSKIDESTLKSSSTTNKKLLRQKSVAKEEINTDITKVIKADSSKLSKEEETKIHTKTDTTSFAKTDPKKDVDSSHFTIPKAETIAGPSKSSVMKTTPEIMYTTSSILTVSKPISNPVVATSSKTKAIAETVSSNTLTNVTSTSNDVSKSSSKTLVTASKSIKDYKESGPTSINISTSRPLTSSTITSTPASLKTDGIPKPFVSDSPKTCTDTVKTSLPSYIVSTSKTKIGSTLTSTTSPITTKSQTQKPLLDANTSNQSAKSSTSGVKSSIPTPTNGTKPPSQTKTIGDANKKGGRA